MLTFFSVIEFRRKSDTHQELHTKVLVVVVIVDLHTTFRINNLWLGLEDLVFTIPPQTLGDEILPRCVRLSPDTSDTCVIRVILFPSSLPLSVLPWQRWLSGTPFSPTGTGWHDCVTSSVRKPRKWLPGKKRRGSYPDPLWNHRKRLLD